MEVNNLKRKIVYVLNKNEGIIAVFNKDDKDTLIDPIIDEVQNAEAKLTFQVPASSEKWKNTYNPENLYLVDGKIFSANFSDCIERERTNNNEDIITVIAYERQKLLEREYVRAWNSTTGFESIDEFMVVVLSNGNLDLYNNDLIVPTTHAKGTSGYVLDALLYGTGWTTGICDVEGIFDFETDMTNIYENILKVQEIWGGILVFDSLNKTVSHRDETQYLPYSGFEVKYQKNLQSSRYIGDNKIITKLCPLGEGSLNIKTVNNGSIWLENYSYTNTVLKSIENNPDIYEAQQLKAWGERKLQELCKPRRELTMTTALLNSVEGHELEEIHLNDIVDVIDYEFVEDRTIQLRVLEYKHYIWTGADAELVIGDITLESTDIFKKNVQATNLINNGTLDTSRVIDYYKNGQSLKETLRQVDQIITDTRSEFSQADNEIRASVIQTNTRVDNLNDDIVSQDRKISELILNVEGLTSKVSTIADLTEQITGRSGRLVLDNAVEGYLYELSIEGYDEAFQPTYVSDDTILSDDLELLDQSIILNVYTKNKCPTQSEYYEQGTYEESENLIDNIQNVQLNAYITTFATKNDTIIHYSDENWNYYSQIKYTSNSNNFYYLTVKPNTKYKIDLNIEVPFNENYVWSVATYTDTSWIEKAQTENFESIQLTGSKSNYYFDNSWKKNANLNSFEITTGPTDTCLIIYGSYALIGSRLNDISIYDLTDYSENYLRTKEPFSVTPNSNMYFSLNNGKFRFVNLYFYNQFKESIGNWNSLNPQNTIKDLTEKAIIIPQNAYYMNYVIRKELEAINSNSSNSSNGSSSSSSSSSNSSTIISSKGGIVYPGQENTEEEEVVVETLEITPEEILIAKPQLEYGNEKTDFINYNTQRWEFILDEPMRSMESQDYIDNIAPIESYGYELGNYSISTGNKTDADNRLRITDKLSTTNNDSLKFEIEDDIFKFENIFFYDFYGNYINDYNTLNPEDTINGLTSKIINLSNNIYYLTYVLKKVDNTEITTAERNELSLKIKKKTKVFDEFTIIDKNAVLIKRIGINELDEKYVLTNPQYISYGTVEIITVLGLNILEVYKYTPKMIGRYVVQNEYTDLFSTRVEVQTLIKQTDDMILLSASKKVSIDNMIEELNSQILIKPEIIVIEGNKIRIKSDYFECTEDGTIRARRGEFAGFNMWYDYYDNNLRSWLTKDFTYNGNTYRSGMSIRDDYNSDFLFAGMPINNDGSWNTINSAFRVLNNGTTYIKDLNILFNSLRRSMYLNGGDIIWYIDDENNNEFARLNQNLNDMVMFLDSAYAFSIFDLLHPDMSSGPLIFRASRYDPNSADTQNARGHKIINYAYTHVVGRDQGGTPYSLYVQGYEVQTSASDVRKKDNIKKSLINALWQNNSIEYISFDWNEKLEPRKAMEEGHIRCGMKAQQVKGVNSNLVFYDKEFDTYQINLLNYTCVLGKALQEEDAKVEKLIKENNSLKEENKKINAKIDKMTEILTQINQKLNLGIDMDNLLN